MMSNPVNHIGLLLIDLQEIFLRTIPNNQRLINRIRFVVRASELLGISVAVTEQLPCNLGATTPELSQLLPSKTPVFNKSTFSALKAEGIKEWIDDRQIDHILIAGIESPICIYQTAVQALSINLGVTILADCVGERRTEDRAASLRQLLTMGAHVLSSETIFYSLLGSAEHPKFREFTKLVKRAK